MSLYKIMPDQLSDISCLAIEDMLKNRENKINKCPHCNYTYYIKHGYYNNLQRFKCKNINCNRTFSATTKSLWSYSKKSFNLWKGFIKLMFENNSLAHCAEILQIHVSTAFFWRHKILVSMNLSLQPGELKEFVEMSKLKFIENFKGSRKVLTTIRKPIWLISAVDIHNTILSDVVSIGPINVNIIRNSIYKSIPKDAYLNCYTDIHLRALGKTHNKSLKTTYPLDKKLALSFSRLIPKWFFRFKGIATKYLNSYLTWYTLYFQNYNNDFLQFITHISLKNPFTTMNEIRSFKLCCAS